MLEAVIAAFVTCFVVIVVIGHVLLILALWSPGKHAHAEVRDADAAQPADAAAAHVSRS